ncbi:LysR family transcriptional regulator [Variovorax fucosicus]|uniref:LysR family transcriptional regulator n=1 Tax=Variovorax fucosicus TaxID=3053517 RepID=UPI00257524A4|nr:LysR family transcriptional regulator [Variovorax sp. J22G47]MDM0055996.1 LysR family transcriptional regulator [Variovorax sp. J22G47]
MNETTDTSDAGLLDIKLLRLFELLYSTHSVTRAAEQLGQSQPTVSIWLARLRRQLNDPLFVRTPSGMQPTPRAEMLIGIVREALRSLRQLAIAQAVFDPATASRRFRICMTDASHVTLLPQLLAHVRASAPKVRLVAARIDGETAQALQSGEADLAIGLVPWLESGFYQQVLFPQDWVCLVNARHPRIGAKALGLRDYKAEAHVGIAGGTGGQLLEAALARHRIERRVQLELPGFLGLAAIVATTDLVATLPRHIGETLARTGGLTVFPCPLPVPPFTVKQHWHARYHEDPANRWLRELCARLFAARGQHAPKPVRRMASR